MWNPIDNWKQQRARERFLPHARTDRTQRTAVVAIGALVLILLATALLDLGGGGEGEALAQYVEAEGRPPLDLIEEAARAHRLVFLSDIAGSSATKALAADVIERLAGSTTLDVVALSIDADEQRYIDLYLNSAEEDASLLIGRPRLLHEADGVSQAYLELFRRVRRLNEELGADRQIRILALDSPDWPPARAATPHELAQRFGARDQHMYETVAALLAREPRARVLFLLDGLHALRNAAGNIQAGGTSTVRAEWLASRLQRDYPQDVYSILMDAPSSRTVAPQVVAYRGTRAARLLAENGGADRVAVPFGEVFEFTRQPLRLAVRTGVTFDMDPHGFTLPQVADAWVYLGD